jgi:CubicO group peptidase (beta-lactamase class C family)
MPVVQRVQRWVDDGYYPGAGLVIGRRGQVALEHYFGSYTPETEELIASAGKWLAAAAIATVVDRGLLGWGDTVGQWLPELGAELRDITLRQLLSHTSGLEPQQPPGRHDDDYQTLAESVAHIATLPPRERPGTRFRYGGLSMQVAGRLAELAAGQSFDELFEHGLARPLELEHTRFTPVDPRPGHNPKLGGGARSTARDYARFLSMIAAGGFLGERILSPAAIAEMERDQVGAARLEPGELVERVRGASHTGVYGLGLWRERLDASGRATLLSSPSWAGAYPWLDRQRDLYGVLIAHVDLAGPAGSRGFNPYHSSPILADLAAAAVDAAEIRGGACADDLPGQGRGARSAREGVHVCQSEDHVWRQARRPGRYHLRLRQRK